MSNAYFKFKQFTVWQDLCGMKVGTDGTLLGAWARVPGGACRVLDVGTGTGLIALMMAQRAPEAEVVGIDIDEGAVRQAMANVAASPFDGRIRIVKGDVADFDEGRFQAVVSNPPYFVDSLQCPDEQRTLARHTASLTYDVLARAAYRLLSDDGTLSVVIPSECRERLVAEAALAGFIMSRLCAVKTTPRKLPKRYLIEFAKYSVGETYTSEIVIETSPNVRSEEYQRLTKDFYL